MQKDIIGVESEAGPTEQKFSKYGADRHAPKDHEMLSTLDQQEPTYYIANPASPATLAPKS